MKRMKTIAMVLTCLLVLAMVPAGWAEEEAEGPLVITFPEENAEIVYGEPVESYIISWEPLEDVFEYRIGAYAIIEVEGAQYWGLLGDGYIGGGYVINGDGEQFMVQNAPFGGMSIEGDQQEADIAELINLITSYEGGLPIGGTLVVLINPQSGEPLVQNIELPFAAEE